MTVDELKIYAESLGYKLSNSDCYDIISTSYEGETVNDAVDDFLNAYER